MGQLSGKTIAVVGGTSGLGLSACLAFVKEGARVVAMGRNPVTVDRAQTLLGPTALVRAGDACSEDDVDSLLANCDRLDGLYHVAGGSGRKSGDGPLHEMTVEAWNSTFQLNLTSVMISNRTAIRHFMDRKAGGAILNMGSVLGFSPSPQFFATHAYAATKSAIIGFSRSIAAYYAAWDIRVNVIAPALVETPMAGRAASDEKILGFIRKKQPLDGGRIGRSDDLDAAAVYFFSEGSRFTTGQVLAVDGGWCLAEGGA